MTAGQETGDGRWRAWIAATLCYGFDALDFMLLALCLPAMMAEWKLGLAEAGLLGAAGMAGVAVSALLLGAVSDRVGRKPALVISVTIFSVFTGATAFARSPLDVMVLRFLAGLGLGGVWPAATTLVNETWPARGRTRAVSWMLAVWPAGVAGAALLAQAVLPGHGWRRLFLFGFASLAAAVFTQVFCPESPAWQAEARNGRERPAPPMAALMTPELIGSTLFGALLSAFAMTAYWGVNTWLPTFLAREHGFGPAEASRYLLFLNAGMFIGYPALGLAAERFGPRATLLGSYVCIAALLPAYAFIRSAQTLFWAGPVVWFFFAQTGVFGVYFPRLFPTALRGLGSGFCYNVGRGAAALSPYLLGGLAQAVGLGPAIGLCGLLYVGAGAALFFLPKATPYLTEA